jgi:hypothetical protein
MPEKQEQLEWEARAGRTAAIFAFASVALVIGSIIVQATIGARSDSTRQSLRVADEHSGAITVYAILIALSFLLLIPVLLYLYRAAKFRRPEVPRVTQLTAALGPVLIAITTVGAVFATLNAADEFVRLGPHTEKHADDLVGGGALSVFRGLGLAGGLATAVAFVLIGVHSMRAGLLSRFMGTLGIVSGVLAVIPLTPVPIVQMFWTVALGVMFLGHWPSGGRGPAWETGEPIPWPSAQERYGQPPEEGSDGDEPETEPEPEAPKANPRAPRKRKKKKARR